MSEATIYLKVKKNLIQRTSLPSKNTYTQYYVKAVYAAASVFGLQRKISYSVRQENAFIRNLIWLTF